MFCYFFQGSGSALIECGSGSREIKSQFFKTSKQHSEGGFGSTDSNECGSNRIHNTFFSSYFIPYFVLICYYFKVSSMRSLICTDELATDVTGAEALIERHNEHRVEIDARSNAFQVNVHYGYRDC